MWLPAARSASCETMQVVLSNALLLLVSVMRLSQDFRQAIAAGMHAAQQTGVSARAHAWTI